MPPGHPRFFSPARPRRGKGAESLSGPRVRFWQSAAGMHSVESAGSTSAFQAFTVLIPRPLQPSVEGLPTEVRQALLAELFRMASLAHEHRGALPPLEPYTLKLEVAGCAASVEMDPARSRLTLVGVQRRPPRHA